jgi:serine protease inhibitor ecotin
VGIYSSAVSVSQDIQLRKLIRSYTSTEARLLDSIGYAQMERELEKKVLLLTRQTQKNMKDEYRIESSLTEDDVKQYLGEVIKEIKRDPE